MGSGKPASLTISSSVNTRLTHTRSWGSQHKVSSNFTSRKDDEYHCLFTSRQRKLPSPQLQPIHQRDDWKSWVDYLDLSSFAGFAAASQRRTMNVESWNWWRRLSTCWQLCSHLAPPRNRFRRQTLCENQGKVRQQRKEPILWQISTFWWIRPGGDFQGEDLKLETSDKWRLAKRELICFLPDSLDNDIGINYEDEDGVESAGKLTQ